MRRRRSALRTARQLTMEQRRDASGWWRATDKQRRAIQAALAPAIKPAVYRDVYGWDVCYAAARLGWTIPEATAWAVRQWTALAPADAEQS